MNCDLEQFDSELEDSEVAARKKKLEKDVRLNPASLSFCHLLFSKNKPWWTILIHFLDSFFCFLDSFFWFLYSFLWFLFFLGFDRNKKSWISSKWSSSPTTATSPKWRPCCGCWTMTVWTRKPWKASRRTWTFTWRRRTRAFSRTLRTSTRASTWTRQVRFLSFTISALITRILTPVRDFIVCSRGFTAGQSGAQRHVPGLGRCEKVAIEWRGHARTGVWRAEAVAEDSRPGLQCGHKTGRYQSNGHVASSKTQVGIFFWIRNKISVRASMDWLIDWLIDWLDFFSFFFFFSSHLPFFFHSCLSWWRYEIFPLSRCSRSQSLPNPPVQPPLLQAYAAAAGLPCLWKSLLNVFSLSRSNLFLSLLAAKALPLSHAAAMTKQTSLSTAPPLVEERETPPLKRPDQERQSVAKTPPPAPTAPVPPQGQSLLSLTIFPMMSSNLEWKTIVKRYDLWTDFCHSIWAIDWLIG